ncbi:MAG: shikimate dehydrogenase family protein, partial [Acutalibacteraceae bacterium]
TIPHKQAIIPFIDELDKRAKLYKSVNTFFNDNGIYKGYTTDPDGFLLSLSSNGIPLSGNVFIAGCGGVARTMAYEAIIKKCKLTFAIRKEDTEMAKDLKHQIEKDFTGSDVSICDINEIDADIDLLVNATPVGMYPKSDACPVSDRAISHSKAVFDAIYNPLETLLIKKAKANGSKAVGGMSMLVWQAVSAQKKWNDVDFDTEEINRLCIKCERELQNR